MLRWKYTGHSHPEKKNIYIYIERERVWEIDR